ncbi:sulfur carrier protein ThiS [Paramicrobacterium agarici]|uniref:sulfur carrier protein ThiS n=1 Tax=Paramicrobacterium agarici TaxID=630514 RepID=UPI00114FBB9E|nr:sulfur carrier protein ThiS [Microbacterium agarici]TQO21618.1 sulfur carrier protein [Microbacterium agarici]
MSTNVNGITVNGAPRSIDNGMTLVEIVAEITGRDLSQDGTPADGASLGVAAAVDGTVVPRSRWSAHVLESGQTIDIVTAVQGG